MLFRSELEKWLRDGVVFPENPEPMLRIGKSYLGTTVSYTHLDVYKRQMLTSRKGLAMTSSTPGKTMLINHFLINKNWYLVDLPGYGLSLIHISPL